MRELEQGGTIPRTTDILYIKPLNIYNKESSTMG
jgi:hypothetical protein